jgi:hypothetical protein
LAPGREPVYVLPRMFVRFHLDGEGPPGSIVVEDDGDGRAAFTEAAEELGSPTRIRRRRHVDDGARRASRARAARPWLALPFLSDAHLHQG